MSLQLDLLLGDLAAPSAGEYRVTPAWALRDLVATRFVTIPLRGVRILDACAGLGAIGLELERMSAEGLDGQDDATLERCRARVSAIERHPGRAAALPEHWEVIRGDVLAVAKQARRAGRRWQLIVCNPPFSAWFEIAEALLNLRTKLDGQLWVIGPWEYRARTSAAEWWERHPPNWQLPLRRRPWPDAVRECAWFGWTSMGGLMDRACRFAGRR